jgi:hypothetical protein
MNRIVQSCGYRPKEGSDTDISLDGDLVYENDYYIIILYKGFCSDGMSIPALIWSIIQLSPFDVRCAYGSFVHDFLYSSQLLDRAIADEILDEILQIKPRPNWTQRWLVWTHLRMYGWVAWNGKTEEQIAEARKMGEVIYKQRLTKAVLI